MIVEEREILIFFKPSGDVFFDLCFNLFEVRLAEFIVNTCYRGEVSIFSC